MTQEEAQILDGEKIRTLRMNDGAIWRVSLNAPKGNVVDSVMTRELTELFVAAKADPRVKAVLLTAEGDDFSFGASVEEHRAEKVKDMLAGFHGLFRAIAASGVPMLAAVRGKCLGGGLELVAFAQRIYVHPEARFGQPEIKLGVFAPVGSAILAERCGRGGADDLLLSGRSVKASKALDIRLVDVVTETPEAAALSWAEKHFVPRSGSSLRIATRAARLAFLRRFERDIEELERLYLDELMTTRDANEGIASFLEKREPTWSNE